VIAFLLTWSPINIWEMLPKQLWVTQFTFRFLTHMMWTGAVLTAFATILIFRERLDRRHLLAGILIIIILSRPWLPTPRGNVTVESVLKAPLFRNSGALDYLYRTPITNLFGKAELPVLALDWIPSFASWDTFLNRNLELFAQYPDAKSLQENKPVGYLSRFRYPKPIGEHPFLLIQGEIFAADLTSASSVLVQINQENVAEIPLNTPQFNLQIPLSNLKSSDPDFVLTFLLKAPSPETKPPRIFIKKFAFDGLSPQNTIIPMTQIKDNCQQQGKVTVCNIQVNSSAENVQLPVLYYPDLQKVTANGKVLDYFPINYQDYHLVGIKLKPGSYEIKTVFIGLAWANWISLVSWFMVILMLIKLKFFSPDDLNSKKLLFPKNQ
jgi:hypothetical protein